MNKLPFDVKREVISKGFKPSNELPKRPVKELLRQGLVIIDKPSGPISREVTDQVKRLLHAKKAGHAGTLDPKVTGVLPIAINYGCKVLTALRTDKEYECVMLLHSEASESLIKESGKQFIGVIKQLPPVKSSVKREVRQRKVYYLDIKKIEGRLVNFIIGCEAGTYVRKICSDWGDLIKVKAHMKSLRRTKSGPFTLKDAVGFDEFKNEPTKYLLPVERGVTHLPWVWIDEPTVKRVINGMQVNTTGITAFHSGIKKDELIALMNHDNELIALAKAEMSSEEMKGESRVACKTERVIISQA